MRENTNTIKGDGGRLIPFIVSLICLFLLLELFARFNTEHFFALSDKVLLKAQILRRAPDTRILFLGSSRFLDAIDARTFTATLERETGEEFRTFNGATTGLNVERFSYFARVARGREGLTHIVLEASKPVLIEGDLGFVDERAPSASEDAATDAEGFLRQAIVRRVEFIKHRKALRPKVLLKLLVLYTANSIDPDIWSRKGTLKQIFYRPRARATEVMKLRYEPNIVRAGVSDDEPATPEGKSMLANMRRVAGIFRDANVTVIWLAPPVSVDQAATNSNVEIEACYRRVAEEFDTIVFDYAGCGLDESLLRDTTHLNADGRSVFSEIFAEHLARELGADAF
jgi:hypothetical protein